MKWAALVLGIFIVSAGVWGQKPPLLAERDVAAIAGEISGETAKRNLEGIARFHRQRGSLEFHFAALLVAVKLDFYGLSDVSILRFPADGKVLYGTQRSRPAWDARDGELWEIKAGSDAVEKIADYKAEPVALAEDSESADVATELVDVGGGMKDSDYAGTDVKGKIVLVSAQPGAVQDLAVGKFGAVGIVSYAQNQKTAWSGENLDAVRWGHLETFSPNKTFGFMVSLRTAHVFQSRLAKGEKIRLHAVVKAGQHPGNYEVVTATIPGSDTKLKNDEIVFSCHLDHQRPGANDNASGCATILEAARALQHLISVGKLARPARTIRFVFPPEIEGTMALMNSKGDKSEAVDWREFINMTGIDGPPMNKPEKHESGLGLPGGVEWAKRVKAVVHMDMVGGGPETKAVFHVTRGPMSLPSFVQDVAWAFAEWVNEESYQFAATGKAEYPLVSAEGGKEPLRAEYSAYTMGSDHDVYQDSSFGIPAIYLNDWPDRFIHTNLDSAANIDATKLKRAGFIGAASGYFLARLNEENVEEALRLVRLDIARLVIEIAWKRTQVSAYDGGEIQRFAGTQLRPLVKSVTNFVGVQFERGTPTLAQIGQNLDRNGEGMSLRALNDGGESARRYRRKSNPKGPMAVFGFDYFDVEWAKRGHMTKPKLLEYQGLWGAGEEYAYEVLNFAHENRNAQEIDDAVSAEYGPVPLEMVEEYLRALEEIGVVEREK
ncbi:MAG TPA: M28 family peptidase [Candidatus Acidoferrales bacterium]|jgi:aminopeptidase YwaD|nr:M28 family peptidase [Candidatus Acidoferrales bacterium]